MKVNKLSSSSDKTAMIIIAVGLIVTAVVTRLLPHPANFAPIAAVALFGGAVLPRKWALTLPLFCMIISDLIIGLHPLILFTWGSFAVIALLGSRYLKKITPLTVVGASIGASVLFYLVSNFGVWLEGRLYPVTLQGLIHCYYNALPFFRNTLVGDLVFSTILFGTYALAYKAAIQKPNSNGLIKT